MESIRVKNRDVYEIEVNDDGETIVFDLTDIGLPFRLEKAIDTASAARDWLKGQILLIEKLPEEKSEKLLSKKERAVLNAEAEAFRRMREAIDLFAGDGASQKIFGNQNYLTMFSDFMDEMNPHIEKMGIKSQDIAQRIKEKYGTVTVDDEI